MYKKALENTDKSIINRIKNCLTIGNISGLFYLSLVILDYLFLFILVVLCPKKKFRKEKDLNYSKLKEIIKERNIKNGRNK